MPLTEVIAVFDIGKTNKKIFLFDEHYKIVYERSAQLPEIKDEDGDPCEDLASLRAMISDFRDYFLSTKEFNIRAINFSTYGASFVHIGEQGEPVAPLYNYLKQYPEDLKNQFYNKYGGEKEISVQTASPVLGSLNSGLQLYRIKFEKPHLYKSIKYSLHLPQYLSYLISGELCSEITSIGCHTALWDFKKEDYHTWVYNECIIDKLAPLVPSDHVTNTVFADKHVWSGVGLHDSSAALIPYQTSFTEPFILISTGTWCISLNPFNSSPLTAEELEKDCLSYLTYQGHHVKAARLFAGYEHEKEVEKISGHFDVHKDFYKNVQYDPGIVHQLRSLSAYDSFAKMSAGFRGGTGMSPFGLRDPESFSSPDVAYHQLLLDIVIQQYASTQLVLNNSPVKRIFVDGGFSKNIIYMNLLNIAFPEIEIYAASMAQATAVGAAQAIHRHWNRGNLPNDIIDLKYYA